MQDAMTQGLYEKTADSQEGVLHTVLNQMSDQHTKEVILAYAVLMMRGTSCPLWVAGMHCSSVLVHVAWHAGGWPSEMYTCLSPCTVCKDFLLCLFT